MGEIWHPNMGAEGDTQELLERLEVAILDRKHAEEELRVVPGGAVYRDYLEREATRIARARMDLPIDDVEANATVRGQYLQVIQMRDRGETLEKIIEARSEEIEALEALLRQAQEATTDDS